ncbi:putative ankyrin repeat protein L81 [Madurella mycetomatis]|uniref:Ankyrin repeat protein L81 n=1 Tax=Madurella mycetomatis TaxID=100816 RepID=A0A175W311_9PEZI|nr:putative ankyrin repeat protein L81 [Madurella mycetomatis]
MAAVRLNTTALRQLQLHGAKLDLVDTSGRGILYYLAKWVTPEQIALYSALGLQGFDPDIRDTIGDTALDMFSLRMRGGLGLCNWESTQALAFGFLALVVEIRERNWSSGQSLETRDRLLADGSHQRLKRWLGWQWQRLRNHPELSDMPWDKDDVWFDKFSDDEGGQVDYDISSLFDLGCEGRQESGLEQDTGDDGEFYDALEYLVL